MKSGQCENVVEMEQWCDKVLDVRSFYVHTSLRAHTGPKEAYKLFKIQIYLKLYYIINSDFNIFFPTPPVLHVICGGN